MLVSCVICVALLLDEHKELTVRCHALNLVFILMLYGAINRTLREPDLAVYGPVNVCVWGV